MRFDMSCKKLGQTFSIPASTLRLLYSVWSYLHTTLFMLLKNYHRDTKSFFPWPLQRLSYKIHFISCGNTSIISYKPFIGLAVWSPLRKGHPITSRQFKGMKEGLYQEEVWKHTSACNVGYMRIWWKDSPARKVGNRFAGTR